MTEIPLDYEEHGLLVASKDEPRISTGVGVSFRDMFAIVLVIIGMTGVVLTVVYAYGIAPAVIVLSSIVMAIGLMLAIDTDDRQ